VTVAQHLQFVPSLFDIFRNLLNVKSFISDQSIFHPVLTFFNLIPVVILGDLYISTVARVALGKQIFAA
jgi:hypothetical protein